LAKSCRFCGAEMADDAIKCPECEKMVAGAEILIDKQRQKKKRTKVIIISIIVCIVLAIGIGILTSISKKQKTGGNTYLDAIDMNISAMFENNPNKYLKAYPDFMRSDVEETLGFLAENGFEEYIELLNDELIKVYGSDASVAYEITSKQHWEDDVAQEYLESLFEYVTDYNIEDFPIQDAYELTLEITITGSVGTQTMTTSVAVMQFDDSWYLMNIINLIGQQVDDLTSGK